MRVEPYYKQLPPFTVNGLTLNIGAWTFSCGAIDPSDPAYLLVNLPQTTITFIQDTNYSKLATLYVTPTNDGVDNYYLTEALNNGLQNQSPPTEKWTPDISIVPCLTITVPKLGAGNAITVQANEFDPGPAPDLHRDVNYRGFKVAAYRKGKQPEEWEEIDAKKHKKLFGRRPISLGNLKPGERWYVLTPEAEEELKRKKVDKA